LSNINSPAASVYLVIVWKHFQSRINYPMSGFFKTLQQTKLSRATCGPRAFCFESWQKSSCTYFIYESSVASETKIRNAINQINFEVPVSVQLITTHFVFLCWKFWDEFTDNRQFWNITYATMQHLRASQMFQTRVQLQSQNSLMSEHLMKLYRYSISSIFIKNNMKWYYNMSSMHKYTE